MTKKTYGGRETPEEALVDGVNQHQSADGMLLKSRYPPRVRVWVENEVPPGIDDLIQYLGGEVADPCIEDGRLQFDVIVREPYREMGEKKVSKWGTTNAVSLSHSALEAAGFELGDKVTVDVRDGEIRITPA